MRAPVKYVHDFISPRIAAHMFHRLAEELDWERRADAPRFEYWTNDYGRPYTYGRGAGIRTYESRPSHTVIEACKIMLTAIGTEFPLIADPYEGCFLNRYDGERDWLGWHSDDDPGIDHTRPIAIITLYPSAVQVTELRSIQFKPVDGKGSECIDEQILHQGSLCLMEAGMQYTYLHRIPKAGREVTPRISLTFRGLK